MRSPATLTTGIEPDIGEAPWPGHEYVRGWGVFGLPFDSGHVLALRVFPQSSFGPYRTLWHRDPGGRWSIHADARHVELACPRYYGPACQYVGRARIGLEWTGPRTLRVTMDEPVLDWTVIVARSPLMGLLNPLSAAMPLSSWRPRALVRARELLAQALGMGRLQLAGVMPSGHSGLLMPQRMYLVSQSTAALDGVDLGSPSRPRENPTIGGVPLPARGVLAIGEAMWGINDHDEFESARSDELAALAAQVRALGGVLGGVDRGVVRCLRLGAPSEPAEQVGADGMPRVIAGEGQPVDQGEADVRSVELRDRDRAVERDDR